MCVCVRASVRVRVTTQHTPPADSVKRTACRGRWAAYCIVKHTPTMEQIACSGQLKTDPPVHVVQMRQGDGAPALMQVMQNGGDLLGSLARVLGLPKEKPADSRVCR